MRCAAKCSDELRAYLETVPLVDCHDHSAFCKPNYEDPIQVVIGGYFSSDIQSASSDDDLNRLRDFSIPLEERWPILERAWKRTCHTGYAQVTRRILKKFYDEDELTLEALYRMKDRLLDLTDEKVFEGILKEANIAVRLENISHQQKSILNGTHVPTPRSRVVIGMPFLHNVSTFEAIQNLARIGAGGFNSNLSGSDLS